MKTAKIILFIICFAFINSCVNEFYQQKNRDVKNINTLSPEQQRRLAEYEQQKKNERASAVKDLMQKQKYEQIKNARSDVKNAEAAYVQSVNKLKNLASIGFDTLFIDSVINRQEEWILSDPESEIYDMNLQSSGIIDAEHSGNHNKSNSGIMNDIEYLQATQPFYDQMRMRAIALQAMASRNNDLSKYIMENPNVNRTGLENFANKNSPIKYLNYYSKYLEQNNDKSVISDALVYCVPTEGYSLTDAVGDIASLFSGLFAGSISIASGISDSKFFSCQFRKGVQKYTVQLFFTEGNNKYRTKTTKDVTKDDWYNGINFDTTTWVSNLDYIAVRVVANENGKTVEDAVVYKVSKNSGDLQRVNIQNFMNNVMDQYTLQ